MRDERLEVSVTFDERGYIGSAPELRWPVTALSLGGLRRKIEIAMLPDDVHLPAHEVCRQFGQAVETTLGEAEFDGDVLAFDEACLP